MMQKHFILTIDWSEKANCKRLKVTPKKYEDRWKTHYKETPKKTKALQRDSQIQQSVTKHLQTQNDCRTHKATRSHSKETVVSGKNNSSSSFVSTGDKASEEMAPLDGARYPTCTRGKNRVTSAETDTQTERQQKEKKHDNVLTCLHTVSSEETFSIWAVKRQNLPINLLSFSACSI